MATMNRNVNLEEVNSDAFMGIPFLNYQTTGQKVIFWGSVIVAVGWNIVGTFAFHINVNIIILCTLIPLLFGVAFGCNYNQDLSLFDYLRLALFKPSTVYVTKPEEDIEQIKQEIIRIDKEAEFNAKKQSVTYESQRRLLIGLLVGSIFIIIIFVILLIVIATTNTDVLHHIIEM
jgi:hypothetical protein